MKGILSGCLSDIHYHLKIYLDTIWLSYGHKLEMLTLFPTESMKLLYSRNAHCGNLNANSEMSFN